jgi:hypothetical protein
VAFAAAYSDSDVEVVAGPGAAALVEHVAAVALGGVLLAAVRAVPVPDC